MTDRNLANQSSVVPTGSYVVASPTVSLTTLGYQLLNNTLNDTDNSTNTTVAPDDAPPPYEGWQAALIIIVLCGIMMGTVIGNALVCLAVALVRKLRTPSNLLIVSLAVADLSVAIFVMPFAALMEVTKGSWPLGETVCDMWVSLDVLLCTASILNLCAISLDRYFVITRPLQYAVKRTPKLMAVMISAVWGSSAVISIPPLFGWKQEYIDGHCMVSQEIGYQVYATLGAFYFPLTVMIIVYFRIFRISAKLAKAEARSKPAGLESERSSSGGSHSGLKMNSVLKRGSDNENKEENHNCPNGSAKRASKDSNDETRLEMIPKSTGTKRMRLGFKGLHIGGNRSHRASGDTKAIKTLGVIMGGFIACWLPFFILALVRPFTSKNNWFIPEWVNSLFLWLGYLNSLMNPIIYAKFNRDFRTPFKEILLFRCKSINNRLRSESYAEQYGMPLHLRDSMRRESNARRSSLLQQHQSDYRSPSDTVVRVDNQGSGGASVHLGNGTPQPTTTAECEANV